MLREDADAAVDAETAERVLTDWARSRLTELLPADDVWLARVRFLARAMPEYGLPGDVDSLARQALPAAAAGKRSVADLRAALVPAMRDLLDYSLVCLIETEAPDSIEVPTGNRIRLDYACDPPVLAVRLQELFGLTQTPHIAAGRVAVRLHLLGPNFRPVQITDDLQSFWKTTYFQVRKDLRVRYPKHAWPEDPLSATPVARGGRRRA